MNWWETEPLPGAVLCGDEEKVLTFLLFGASPRNKENYPTCLSLALLGKRENICDLLLRHDKGNLHPDMLSHAIIGGYGNLFSMILDRLHPGTRDFSGVMMTAFKYGKRECLLELLGKVGKDMFSESAGKLIREGKEQEGGFALSCLFLHRYSKGRDKCDQFSL